MKNYCVTHQTVWFKLGKMKGYAHPIKDADGKTTGWCNRLKDYDEQQEPETQEPIKSETTREAIKELIKEVKRGTLDSKQTSIEGQTSFKALTHIFMTWFKVPTSLKEMRKALPDDDWRHLLDGWKIGLTKIDPWLYGGEEHAKALFPDKTIVESPAEVEEIKPIQSIAEVPDYQGWLKEVYPQVKHLITSKTFTSLALPLPNSKQGILAYTKSLSDGERVLFFDAIKSKLEQPNKLEDITY